LKHIIEHTLRLSYDIWGRLCNGIGIFTPKYDPELPKEQVVLEVPGGEAYQNMWSKTRAIAQYLVNNSVVQSYDFVLTCGDDNYVLVDHLRKYLSTFDLMKDPLLYLGFRMKFSESLYFNTGGAGYVLSREAYLLLHKALPSCGVHDRTSIEDVWVSRCLKKFDVYARNTQDGLKRNRFLPFGLLHVWLTNESATQTVGWFIKYAPDHVYGLDGILPEVVTLHGLALYEEEAFHAILYGVRRANASLSVL
jgi:hypothetical protein